MLTHMQCEAIRTCLGEIRIPPHTTASWLTSCTMNGKVSTKELGTTDSDRSKENDFVNRVKRFFWGPSRFFMNCD